LNRTETGSLPVSREKKKARGVWLGFLRLPQEPDYNGAAAKFIGWRMSVVTSNINHCRQKWPKKQVSIRRDDKDFVVAFQPEDFVIFRNGDANALRRVCRLLRWEVVSDTTPEANDFG
jgi:hypothetical protein